MKAKYPHNKAAQHAIAFVEALSLVGDDSGKPVKLLPFQREIIATLFGTLDRAGKRKIKRAFIFLPRKQAKTFLAACIVLYWLFGRGLKGQQCLSIANDREQAALLFSMAKQMVEADEYLDQNCEIVESTKRVSVPSVYSFYAALSTESTTKTGFSPALVIVDEAQDIRDASLIKNITTGRTARDDYLTVFIGTAGTRKDTTFYAEYEYAKQWKAGIIQNDSYAAWIFEAEETDDWGSEETWRKVMPAYGKFCKPAAVKEEYELAKKLPHKELDFKQYLLNIWQIYGAAKFITDKDWMANGAAPLGDAQQYFAGLDLASVNDSSSLVLFGKNSEGTFDVIPVVWVCEAQVARRQTAQFDYSQWQRGGFLRVTPGEAQDPEAIARDIIELRKTYPFKTIAIDRWGSNWLSQKLIQEGFDVQGFGQGFKDMSPPVKRLQKLVLQSQLRHGGHPVLRWMCSNARVDQDAAENVKLNKDKSDEKIDGMVALAMAIGIETPNSLEAEFKLGRSVYEDRGFLVF